MSNRVCVVAGANRGIGREVARRLAAGGDTVILTARDPQKASAARDALQVEGGDVIARQLDVTDRESARRLAEFVGESWGRLDVLVNNAAIHCDTDQQATTADLRVVREALETNLLGAWQTTQALLPQLQASKHGRIVNVSSEGGSLTRMGAGTPCGCRKPMPPGDIHESRPQRGRAAGRGRGPGQ